jgi:hypothetical protein
MRQKQLLVTTMLIMAAVMFSCQRSASEELIKSAPAASQPAVDQKVTAVPLTSQVATGEKIITVLNPMGTPPPIQRKAMAARLETLEGKTLYFVTTGYIGSDRLMDVMMNWFKENYPKTTVVRKSSGLTSVDEKLWSEIGEKADGVIIGVGH